MTRAYRPVDLSKIKLISVQRRRHKAGIENVAKLPEVGATAAELFNSMPRFLGAQAFRNTVSAIAAAVRHQRPVVLAFGAHVLKVGCGPVLIDLIRRGVVSAVAGNGATAIHDFELASLGETSEEVADTIRDGTFGMVQETMEFFDAAAQFAARNKIGLGEAVGRLLVERETPHPEQSVFAAAALAGIPASVHVALGTDTIHMSAKADGGAIGTASMHDFRLICDVVGNLGAAEGGSVGGVWLNVGSAVILPEVFLKAVGIARNLGVNLDAMTTANFDMIRHYRPHQNVVLRPVVPGFGHEVIGQHELILPLLRQAVIEKLARPGDA